MKSLLIEHLHIPKISLKVQSVKDHAISTQKMANKHDEGLFRGIQSREFDLCAVLVKYLEGTSFMKGIWRDDVFRVCHVR